MRTDALEIKQLTTFLAVSEARSFGKAANTLGYTQSAVSQQIAGLERALGMPVFHRPGGPKPVELTRAGEVLEVHARTIIEQIRNASLDLDGLRDGTRGRLAIGSFQSVSVRLLPGIVQQLAVERPELDLQLVETDDPPEVIALIEHRELDAAFLVGGLIDHPFEEIVLFDDPFVVVSSARSATATAKTPIKLLGELPLIGSHPDDMCQRRIDAGLQSHGLSLDFVFRSSDNGAIQAMVRAGRGVAVMPRLAVDFNDPDVVVTEIDPPIPPRSITFVWRADADTLPAVERFIELAIEVSKPFAAI